jgi:aspartyl-tRNA(Asn)/glutamyl-tRNA(Gln) amidotransferase subunit A
MGTDELCFLSALELRDLYRRRQISPVEVTRSILERIERLDSKLTAFVTTTPDLAMDQARAAEDAYASGHAEAPLLGVPISIKDITVTKGIRTTRGSLLWEDWVPDFDAPVVERVYAAGAVMLGKSTTPELGWKGDSGNRIVGATINPWKAGRTAGGSSGGAAAAVAAGMGPLSQGTDGAGSIRIPAAFCGVYGIKASFGLVPNYPASSVETLAHNGPITRTVRDSALLLNVMAGPDARDRNSLNATAIDYLAACDRSIAGLRVAWSPNLGYAPVNSEVARLVSQAAEVFAELGCEVEEVDPGIPDPFAALDVIWATGQAAAHGHDFESVRDRLDQGRVPIIERGHRLSGLDLALANVERVSYCDRWRGFMERYDLLLTPTLPITAFNAGDDHPGEINGVPTKYLSWTPFTYPFNMTGQPAATVPCGFDSNGLPAGLQIVGRWRDDVTVLAASAAFEAARPWSHARPPLANGA